MSSVTKETLRNTIIPIVTSIELGLISFISPGIGVTSFFAGVAMTAYHASIKDRAPANHQVNAIIGSLFLGVIGATSCMAINGPYVDACIKNRWLIEKTEKQSAPIAKLPTPESAK